MSDFNHLTDAEINSKINKFLYGVTHPVFNYCRNWSHIGPLISAEGICLDYDGETCEASIDFESNTGAYGTREILSKTCSDTRDNDKRSAAIVFCMMKGLL